jgi:hypothetical protein
MRNLTEIGFVQRMPAPTLVVTIDGKPVALPQEYRILRGFAPPPNLELGFKFTHESARDVNIGSFIDALYQM